MAKISELPAIAAPTGTETVVVLDGGETRRAEIGNLVAAAAAPAIDRIEAIQRSSRYPRIVDNYGLRDGIPAAERYAGMRVHVVDAGLWFEVDPTIFDPANPPLGNKGWRPAPEFAKSQVVYSSPPIVDGDKLYFPAVGIAWYDSNGYTTQAFPTAPNTYVASPVSTTASVRRHVFDRTIFAATNSMDAAIIEVDDAAPPQRDNGTQVILAVTRNGRLIDTRGTSFAGHVPGGTVPNQFRYGREVDDAPFVSSTVEPVAITDPDLLALGLSRGMQSRPNTIASIGDYRPQPFKPGDHVIARFYLKTTVAGQFGQPRLYIYTSESQVQPPIVPPVFREISPTVREYFYAGRLTAAGNGKWAVGTDNQANASLVTIAGVQFACTSVPSFWIGSGDFPSAPSVAPLMADELFLLSDRKLPLFAANGMANRTVAATATIATPAAIEGPFQPLFDGGPASDALWLDPATIGAEGLRLTMRSLAEPHKLLTREVVTKVKRVPFAARQSIRCAYFGDSHSANLFPRILAAILGGCNAEISYFGTLDNTFGERPGEARQYGEGRGGWGISNFFATRSNGTWSAVLGPGQAAVNAYRAGNFNVRQFTNPFLHNGASGSTAPVIPGDLPLLGGGTASGFRLDLVNYRDRFALPLDLDLVLLNLGQNDVNQSGGAGGLAEIRTLYPILIAEIRRAWPNATILCWGDAPGLVNNGELRWIDRRPAMQAMLTAVRAKVQAGDARLHFASTWMHHAVKAGFPVSAGILDPETQVVKRTIADDAHTDHPVTQQVVDALAAAILNVLPITDPGVPATALRSPIDGRFLISPADGRALLKAE